MGGKYYPRNLGAKSNNHSNNKVNSETKIGSCHYHLCDKTNVRVFKCNFCGEYFCREHLKAKKPQAAPFKSDDIQRQIDWQESGGHPCVPYLECQMENEKRKKEQRNFQIIESNSLTKPSVVESVNIGSGESFGWDEKPEKPLSNKESTSEKKVDKKINTKEEKTGFQKWIERNKRNVFKWLDRKTHPYSYLRKEESLILLSVLIGLTFIFWMIYSNIESVNETKIWIFTLGSLIELILFLVIIWLLYRLLINLRYGLRGMRNGFKVIVSLLFVFSCFFLFSNPGIITDSINSFDFNSMNPFDEEVNFSKIFSPSNTNNYYDEYDENDDDFFNQEPSISLEELQTGEKNISLTYRLNGLKQEMQYTVYQGLNDYLASKSRSISYYDTPPTTKDFILRDLNQNEQHRILQDLHSKIQTLTSNPDDQARIAVSVVQYIPYDWDSYYVIGSDGKFPYEVIYNQKGVCGEKSCLLAYLLRELGFGVAILEFEGDNHRAVGIKCPVSYSYQNSGYCFVESTRPTIITDAENDYVGAGKLDSCEIIEICDGYSFDSVSKEYSDAIEYRNLVEKSENNGGILNHSDYNKWQSLVDEYGLLD